MVKDNDFENKITLTTEQDDQTYGGCNNGNFKVTLNGAIEATKTKTEHKINILKELAELHQDMESRYKDALSLRIQNIDSLTMVVSKIQECEDTGHKGRMYVAASGAASGVCMVLAPFTGGLSVIPAIPFAVGGIAGSIANTVKEVNTKKDLFKEASELFIKDKDSIDNLERHEQDFILHTILNYEKLRRLNQSNDETGLQSDSDGDLPDGKNTLSNSQIVDASSLDPIESEKLTPGADTMVIPKSVSEKSILKHVGEDLSKKLAKEAGEEVAHEIGEDISKSVAKDAGKSTSNAIGHGFGQLFGPLVAGVFVVIDIVELVKSSKKIGKTSEVVGQLAQQIDLLRDHEKELNSKAMLHEKSKIETEMVCNRLQFVVKKFTMKPNETELSLSIDTLRKMNEADDMFLEFLEKCDDLSMFSGTTEEVVSSTTKF